MCLQYHPLRVQDHHTHRYTHRPLRTVRYKTNRASRVRECSRATYNWAMLSIKRRAWAQLGRFLRLPDAGAESARADRRQALLRIPFNSLPLRARCVAGGSPVCGQRKAGSEGKGRRRPQSPASPLACVAKPGSGRTVPVRGAVPGVA